MQYVQGTFRRSTYPGPDRILKGESPREFDLKVLMMSPILRLIAVSAMGL